MIASPPVGVLAERFPPLVEAPADAVESVVLFFPEAGLLPFEAVSEVSCVVEVPFFDDGVRVATAPVGPPAVLPEVEDAEADDIVWS
jgi:hypothetical protein